jgi:hypothetical protein
MKILYYSGGMTGSGHVVTGVAMGNALKRKKIECEYSILCGREFADLASDFCHIIIPSEDSKALSRERFHSSELYCAIRDFDPDVMLVDLYWFPIHFFLDELKCKKLLICRQIEDRFFKIRLPNQTLVLNPSQYDLIIKTEPFESGISMRSINPLVIRNRDEILSRERALELLGVDGEGPICLIAYNGVEGEFETIKSKYSHMKDTGYRMIYSTNYSGRGFFPIVDYYNAVDFIIAGAGYNQFWEIIYFDKEAVFIPQSRKFESQEKRIRECQEYYFEENGADQLVDIIMNM